MESYTDEEDMEYMILYNKIEHHCKIVLRTTVEGLTRKETFYMIIYGVYK